MLSLPFSRADGRWADADGMMTAAFTSVSATCVAGLVTQDTEHYWSEFGKGVILVQFQVGGFGIITTAALLALLVRRRFGLRRTSLAAAETRTVALADVRAVLRRVVMIGLSVEVVLAVLLTVRFWWGYHEPLHRAAWRGLFHAVSSFCNAGFSLHSDNLLRYLGDPWVEVPVTVGVVIGGVGFPVITELGRRWRQPTLWSVHTRLTVVGTIGLFLIGWVSMTALEWDNPATLAHLSGPEKVSAGALISSTPRGAGFNTIDYTAAQPGTRAITSILMFIGGGSAGTAGGIKVTTVLLLAFVIWAEVRGRTDVNVGHRSISLETQRQALTLVLLAIGWCVGTIVLILTVSRFSLEEVAFEVVSAFTTAGLSMNLTPRLGTLEQWIIMVTMYVGRLGPVTLATALALNSRRSLVHLPEESPNVG